MKKLLPLSALIILAACGSGSSGTYNDSAVIKKDSTSVATPDTSRLKTDTTNKMSDSTRK